MTRAKSFSGGFAARGFGLRPKICQPSANTENSRPTREKPLVPRVTRIRIFLKPRTFSQESTFRPHETSESAHRNRSPKRFKAASPRESGSKIGGFKIVRNRAGMHLVSFDPHTKARTKLATFELSTHDE